MNNKKLSFEEVKTNLRFSITKIKLIISLLSAIAFFSACEERVLPTGVWYGEIVRTDGAKLSPMAMFFQEDQLNVYCNVITGNHTSFKLSEEKDAIKKREDGSIVYEYNYAGPQTSGYGYNYLRVSVKDNVLHLEKLDHFKADFTKDSLAAMDFKNNHFKNCSVARFLSHYIIGEYVGTLKRSRDNLELSPIKLYGYMDSVVVYCNALFGKENIVSKVIGYNDNGPIFQTRQFKWGLEARAPENIYLDHNGFKAVLLRGYSPNEKTFFENETAWKNPDFFLAGNAYKGYLNHDVQNQALNYLGDAIAPTIVTITILNNKQLSIKSEIEQSYSSVGMALFTMLLNSDDNTKIRDYIITDDGYIHIVKDDNHDNDFLIGPEGKYLKLDSPKGVYAKFERIQ